MSMSLTLQDVSFAYTEGSEMILKQLSLSMTQGEWIAIAGQNGSGKSTLARLLSGQYSPSSGSIFVNGAQVSEVAEQQELRRRTGYVFQNPDHQFVGATIRDDMAFGLENYAVPREDMVAKIDRYARMLQVEELLDRAPHQLSGGQKQRAALAGMMVLEPELIILDEATSMLDPKGRREVLRALSGIQEQGISIVMITHDMEEAFLTDRLIVLHEGRIMADDTPEAVFKQTHVMKETKLTLPFVVEIQQRLIEAGIHFKGSSHSEEELVEQLCKYHLNT